MPSDGRERPGLTARRAASCATVPQELAKLRLRYADAVRLARPRHLVGRDPRLLRLAQRPDGLSLQHRHDPVEKDAKTVVFTRYNGHAFFHRSARPVLEPECSPRWVLSTGRTCACSLLFAGQTSLVMLRSLAEISSLKLRAKCGGQCVIRELPRAGSCQRFREGDCIFWDALLRESSGLTILRPKAFSLKLTF